jgi:VanZ family protein
VAYLVFEHRARSFLLFTAPVIAGCILSFGIEIAQLFTPTRNASLLDVISNTAGAGIGVIAASSLRAFLPPLPARAMQRDGAAVALLCCWAAYLFFPFFPALSRTVFAAKMNMFASSSLADPVPFVSAAAQWFLGGRLLVAAAARSPGALLGLALLAIPAQLFIYSRQPVLADLTGGIAGWSAFLLFKRSRSGVWANAFVALGAVVVRELAPFRWQSTANSFMWAPFGGMLAAEWQRSVLILVEKSLYYGLAVWILRETGIRLAVPALAVFIACLEFAQMHLPGRTPEITDAVIVVLAGFALSIGAPKVEARSD